MAERDRRRGTEKGTNKTNKRYHGGTLGRGIQRSRGIERRTVRSYTRKRGGFKKSISWKHNCPVCKRRFKTKADVEDHMHRHHVMHGDLTQDFLRDATEEEKAELMQRAYLKDKQLKEKEAAKLREKEREKLRRMELQKREYEQNKFQDQRQQINVYRDEHHESDTNLRKNEFSSWKNSSYYGGDNQLNDERGVEEEDEESNNDNLRDSTLSVKNSGRMTGWNDFNEQEDEGGSGGSEEYEEDGHDIHSFNKIYRDKNNMSFYKHFNIDDIYYYIDNPDDMIRVFGAEDIM